MEKYEQYASNLKTLQANTPQVKKQAPILDRQGGPSDYTNG